MNRPVQAIVSSLFVLQMAAGILPKSRHTQNKHITETSR
jgi:hypothetical protein